MCASFMLVAGGLIEIIILYEVTRIPLNGQRHPAITVAEYKADKKHFE